jgi:hypothetical protein
MTHIFGIFVCLLTLGVASNSFALPKVQRYAVAEMATPVLNTPDFQGVFGGPHGMTLKADTCGQLPALEFIALPKTVFTIVDVLKRSGQTIYRVTTEDYPYPEPKGYYLDSRFVRLKLVKPPPRPRELPPREKIIEQLLAAQGLPYVWGGNVSGGVPQMLLFYPPAVPLQSQELMHRWLMSGVDCSGLLYEATGGFTPRNTSSLITFGQPVRIAGLGVNAIIDKVQPLDLIVWNGHVMIILDQERAIESRPDCHGKQDGVRLVALQDLLSDLLTKRLAVDDHGDSKESERKSFVIRRWYGMAAARETRFHGALAHSEFPSAARR